MACRPEFRLLALQRAAFGSHWSLATERILRDGPENRISLSAALVLQELIRRDQPLQRMPPVFPIDSSSQENTMDFLERILGFAPDNGDGSLEFLLLAIASACFAYFVWRRRQASARVRKRILI